MFCSCEARPEKDFLEKNYSFLICFLLGIGLLFLGYRRRNICSFSIVLISVRKLLKMLVLHGSAYYSDASRLGNWICSAAERPEFKSRFYIQT